MARRVFLIVLDSVGVGEAPDAERFDDVGCDTFGTCVRSGNLHIPVMESLGIYNLQGTSFQKNREKVIACYGKMQEQSAGKDTTVGHWEIAGVISPKPMPTYPHGFPQEIIQEFEQKTRRGTLCNQVYSGTEVIKDYGKEHVETGKLIVYTSADSVFQVAAHEEVVPLEELYEDCRIARKILTGEHGVGRVIARPFVGTYPNYTRTVNRHDFSLMPPKETILDTLKRAEKDVIGVGKIYDIFAGRGITKTYPNEGNQKNMERVLELMEKEFSGLCFVNLVDFDMLYGHRNDVSGYAKALTYFDQQLPKILSAMEPEDVLMITADHGCDPGTPSTDHSREYTPFIMYGKNLPHGKNMGTRGSFSDIGATVLDYFGLSWNIAGESML